MKPYLLCSVQKTVIKFVLLLLLLLLLVLSCFGLLLSCCADVRLPVEGKACAYLQSQADRVQVEIDETTAKLAEVAARVVAAAETMAAAIVHHPELQWEQAASAMMLLKLGAVKDLFDKDKPLRDFK